MPYLYALAGFALLFGGGELLVRGAVYLTGGLAALVIGSRLMIDGATEIALALGVPEAVIGLTLVALGTSLPELATTVMAAVRGHSDVAVGNVVGSNTFNSLGVIGAAAMVTPITFDTRFARFDAWVMLGAALLVLPLLVGDKRMGRLRGAGLLALYVMYTIALFVR